MPPVHSVSYGNDEAQQTGRAYMDSVNTAFAKLSMTGVTISSLQEIKASGAAKVLVPNTTRISRPEALMSRLLVGQISNPRASSARRRRGPMAEVGFSNDFTRRPKWQDSYVEKYLQEAKGSLPKFPHVYNASSRAYPDLSALAGVVNAYLVALEGGSASRPLEGRGWRRPSSPGLSVKSTTAACPRASLH